MNLSAPFKIRVNIRDKEIEVSGPKSDVLSTFERDLPMLLGKVSKAFERISKTPPIQVAPEIREPPSEEVTAEALPQVDVSDVKSCSDAIVKLMSSDWGRRPRTPGDIQSALQQLALFYPATTLSPVLIRLSRSGQLRRWKTAGGYVYVKI